jgi:TPR repeat protein
MAAAGFVAQHAVMAQTEWVGTRIGATPESPPPQVRRVALRVVRSSSLLDQIQPCNESRPDGKSSYPMPSELSDATRAQIDSLLKAANPDQRDLGAAMSAYIDKTGMPQSQRALSVLSSERQNAFAALMLQHLSAVGYTLAPGITPDQHAAIDAVTKLTAMTKTKGWSGEAVALSWLANVYRSGLGGKKPDEYTAFKFMDQAARTKYSYAVAIVAIMYANGRGIFPDKVKAFELFKLAAASGDEYSRLAAADALADGDGVPKNVEEAMKLYQQGANANYTPSLEKLGWIHWLGIDGSGIRRSFEQSERYFQRAIDAGSDTALVALSQIYLQEAVDTKDGERKKFLTSNAEKMISDAVQAGNSDAMVMMGDRFKSAGRLPDAFKEYERAAKLGDANGAFNAGYLLDNDGDKKNSAAYYEQAVKAGVPAAMYYLGRLLSEGDGVPQDTARAFKLYETASRAGHTCAMVSIAVALSNGIGVAKDERASFSFFQKAAFQGNGTGMWSTGRSLYSGRGVAVNKVEGKAWYLRAIKAGEFRAYPEYGKILFDEGETQKAMENWRACSVAKAEADCDLYLGAVLLDGKAVQKDEDAATRYFDQYVAIVGSVCGAAKIGNLYQERRNYPQAIVWYKRGIAGGCTLSMYAYAELLYDGKHVTKDAEAAKQLMKQASEKKMKAATDWLASHP